MNQKVRKWYMSAYPNDTLGEEINPKISFKSVIRALNKRKDIYDVIGVLDSIIRERIFEKLCDISGEDYDVFYYAWLCKIPLDESRRRRK